MKDNEAYEVSDLHEKWLDELHCLIGFTITYANGRIDNQLRNCNKETYLREKAKLNYLRKKFLKEKKALSQVEWVDEKFKYPHACKTFNLK